MQKILGQLATEIKIRPEQVQAAVSLLDGGATVPFIARYRKEATGGLDDIQLRELEYRLGYLREMQERRASILKSIAEQGKLTPDLQLAIDQAATKQDLEDLYLPYKPKRRTKGMIAKEAGIEPLADALWANPSLNPQDEAQAFLKPADAIEGADFSTAGAVLDGVRDILSERWQKTHPSFKPCESGFGRRACSPANWPQAKMKTKLKWPSSEIILPTASPLAVCRHTAHWQCSGAAL